MKICVVRVRVCLYKILRLPAVTVAQGVLLCVLSIALCGPFNPWPGPGIVHAAEGTPDSSGDTSDDTSGYAGDPGDAGGMTDSDPDHSADSNRADVVVDESGDDESGDHFEDDADDDNDGETEAKGFQASVVAALQRGREIDGRRNTAHHGVPIKRLGPLSELTLVRDIESENVPEMTTGRAERITGAQLAEESDELLLMPVPLPSYEIGDAFIYSDGTWERVYTVRGDDITWVNHRGNRSSGSSDFTYKRSSWKTATRRGERRFSPTAYLFTEPTVSLWPLGIGNKTRFDEKGRWVGADGVERFYDSYWRCDVEAAEEVKVAAGEYDAWRIRCARYPDSFSFPRLKAREYRTWYYAPAIQHWVLEIRENQGHRPDTRRELVAVLPDLRKLVDDESATEQLQEQFQDVLETFDNGERALWFAGSGDVAIHITPQESYLLADKIPCRKFVQYVQVGGVNKTYPGIACRNAAGIWRIPRL